MTAQLNLLDTKPSTAGGLIGTKVRLDRNIDRAKPCCKNIAVVGQGKAQHAGELRCADCDRHRGWLPRSALDFLTTLSTRFGAPNP